MRFSGLRFPRPGSDDDRHLIRCVPDSPFGHDLLCGFRAGAPSGRSPTMIVFEDVSVLYRGVPALDRVSLTIPDGALGVLVGPSGSGKSTLIRLVNRLVEPDR